MFAFMDEGLTWTVVAARLKEMPRGAPFQLSKKLGLNSSDFYRRLKRNSGLTEGQARVVREFFEEEPSRTMVQAAPPRSGKKLPVYGYAAASDGERIALNDGDVVDWLELPLGIELGAGEYFVIKPYGSSMEPRIFAGEPLVVRRNYPPAQNKDVVVEFHDGSGVIKTYKGQRSGRVFVEQWNEPKVLDYDATSVKALHAVAFKL